MRTALFAALSLPLLIAAGQASAQPGANADPAAVPDGTYKVEPQHTQVMFAVSHLGFTTYYGRFSDAAGSLVIDAKNPSADRLEVAVPVASVSTTSAKLNGELTGIQWFDAPKFPTIAFKSTKVAVTGPGHAEVTGDLTLHGVTKPVVLAVAFVGAGTNPIDHAYTVGFQATGTIQRSAFGVGAYVPMIGDTVAITLSGAFEK